MNEFTLKTIQILQNCPQCIESIKQVPCDDFQYRFGDLIRVKHGILMTNLIDWSKVTEIIKSQL
jgi:hypothetical protein